MWALASSMGFALLKATQAEIKATRDAMQAEVVRLRDRVDATEEALQKMVGARDLAEEIVRAWDNRTLNRKR